MSVASFGLNHDRGGEQILRCGSAANEEDREDEDAKGNISVSHERPRIWSSGGAGQ
jgi:hypothetical protein